MWIEQPVDSSHGNLSFTSSQKLKTYQKKTRIETYWNYTCPKVKAQKGLIKLFKLPIEGSICFYHKMMQDA